MAHGSFAISDCLVVRLCAGIYAVPFPRSAHDGSWQRGLRVEPDALTCGPARRS
jgi:hypothetical protein